MQDDFRLAAQPTRRERAAPSSPFSIRFTEDERKLLDERRGGRSLGAYIRGRLFGDEVPKQRVKTRKPSHDHKLLAQLLSQLMRSNLGNNLNQIAKAAHMGALPLDDDLQADLRVACEEIGLMRSCLITALGLSDSAQ